MARNVYSILLEGGVIVGGSTVVFPAVAGFQYVIRDLDGQVIGPNINTATLLFQTAGAAPITIQIPPFVTAPFKWSGRIVFNESSGLSISLAGDPSCSVGFTLSGYQLTLP
jgi:hypothetical protein